MKLRQQVVAGRDHLQTQRSKRESFFGYFFFKKSDMSLTPCAYPTFDVIMTISVKFPAKEEVMPNKSFSRAVRLVHIQQSFINRFKNGKREEVTSAKVARALMLEPSAHIRGLLSELVRDGFLSARKVPDQRASNLKGENAFTVFYQLSEIEVEKLKKEEREIEVKSKGVSVGQLRMF